MNILWKISVSLILFAASVFAQTSRPGAISYNEGDVALNGQALSGGQNVQVFLDPNRTLTTRNGRAEILLTPGVFLRIGNNTEVTMLAASLIDTHLQLTHGEAMIECDQLLKENNITIEINHAHVKFLKVGLYRLNAENATVATLKGEIEVASNNLTIHLKKGKQVVIADDLKGQKFDTKHTDDLYTWSTVRSRYDSYASYEASSVQTQPFYGWYWSSGIGWAWMPYRGYAYSPFGWGYGGYGYVGGYYRGYNSGYRGPTYSHGPVNRGSVGARPAPGSGRYGNHGSNQGSSSGGNHPSMGGHASGGHAGGSAGHHR